MIRKLIIALVLGAFSLAGVAQDSDDDQKDRLYVTDQLWLSIYERASEQSTRLGQFRSGDMLVVDEINGPYALVTGPDGERGWVKRGFLNSTPTSNILLAQEQEKTAGLEQEIEKLANSVIKDLEKDKKDDADETHKELKKFYKDELAGLRAKGIETVDEDIPETPLHVDNEPEEIPQPA